ncbi:hypothetical protein HPB51_014777 [Rhipicephalus microplus]|uniref:peptidylprolyl isomerase n=1 Tax=Rhipicephalus microplus TaxID=6941 RepID=A0A9J6DNQ3_RHIMP|nr:hypothetical protein HPB51_014777 [Rhipicephalus microplus]
MTIDKKRYNPRCFFDVKIGDEPAGRIVFELFADVCPITCENFRALCTGECGTGKTTGKPLHYKNVKFHRVIRSFMIQGGDFSVDEGFELKHDQPYLLSMANRGKDTNGSQFFMVHVVFGHVIKGEDVVQAIESQPVDNNSCPLQPVIIANCGELVLKRKHKDKKHKRSASNAPSTGAEEGSSGEKASEHKHRKHHKHHSKKSRKNKSRKRDESAEKHIDKVDDSAEQSFVNPEEIPEVPANNFLMRRVPNEPNFVSQGRRLGGFYSRRPQISRSGRKIKGRGFMRYRTPSPEGGRSGSETPPHWRQAQARMRPFRDTLDVAQDGEQEAGQEEQLPEEGELTNHTEQAAKEKEKENRPRRRFQAAVAAPNATDENQPLPGGDEPPRQRQRKFEEEPRSKRSLREERSPRRRSRSPRDRQSRQRPDEDKSGGRSSGPSQHDVLTTSNKERSRENRAKSPQSRISSGLNTASSLPLSQVKWSSVTSPGTSGATPTPPSTSSRWQSAPSTSKSTEPKQPDRSSQSTSKSLSASKPPSSTKEPEKAGLADKSHSAAKSSSAATKPERTGQAKEAANKAEQPANKPAVTATKMPVASTSHSRSATKTTREVSRRGKDELLSSRSRSRSRKRGRNRSLSQRRRRRSSSSSSTSSSSSDGGGSSDRRRTKSGRSRRRSESGSSSDGSRGGGSSRRGRMRRRRSPSSSSRSSSSSSSSSSDGRGSSRRGHRKRTPVRRKSRRSRSSSNPSKHASSTSPRSLAGFRADRLCARALRALTTFGVIVALADWARPTSPPVADDLRRQCSSDLLDLLYAICRRRHLSQVYPVLGLQ